MLFKLKLLQKNGLWCQGNYLAGDILRPIILIYYDLIDDSLMAATSYKISTYFPWLYFENNLELMISIFASRNDRAVIKHPKPYVMLLNKLIDEASGKYFVGQLTSAIV
jgi:hypothetical protein